MATLNDVRKIALKLPGTSEGGKRQFAISVDVKGKPKGFVWTWMERKQPKKPKEPNDGVLAIAVPNLTAKEMLLASDEEKFFTEPHYNGYPAVLVRLKNVKTKELEELILEAWRCKAPKDLQERYEGM
jgi:hypothetical protein